MSTNSFHFKLLAATLLLMSLIVAPATIAWFGLRQSYLNDLRVTTVRDVLSSQLRLAERGQRLLRHVGSPDARPGDSEEQRLRGDIAREFTTIRNTIAKEIEIIGRGGAAEEQAELEKLDLVRVQLDRAVAGGDKSEWRRLLQLGIAEEEREVRLLDAEEQRLFRWLQWMLALSAGIALIAGALTLRWLTRGLQRPLSRIAAGTHQLATGNLEHRIAYQGADEFSALAADIDAMAADLDRQAKAIAEAKETLESTVAVRTSALEAANSQLAEADSRRRRFLADISHELRTPLAVIRGEAEVTVRAGKEDVEAHRSALVNIAARAKEIGTLIDDLLFVARADAGESKLALRPVALVPMLRQCVEGARPLIEADGGRIAFAADKENLMVTGDVERLRRLMQILLDNAMQFSSDAPEIDVALLSAPGGAQVRVSDSGLGIPAERLPHLFDSYRREGRGNEQDTGALGLPMAKAIVDAHGGTIHVESTEGQGTTVSVFLPASSGLRAVA